MNFKMLSFWENAFGWDRMSIGNLNIGMTLVGFEIRAFEMGGEVMIGKDCFSSK